jgi:uncharacterized protein YifE (UPF0438 family)
MKFKSPVKKFQLGKFKQADHPKSPSPKRNDYPKKAKTKSDTTSRCTYIHPETQKRCKNKLGIYPEFCHLHTLAIHNLYIAPSQIPNAGNGLFAGPYGFKKGDIIGRYNESWNEVSLGQLEKRCKDDHCWSYVFCDDDNQKDYKKTKCWDGLDIRSTLMRNINDAHGSNFKNNSVFDVIKGNVYVIATRNIKPKTEIFVNYGKSYWK